MQDTSGVHVWLVLAKAFHALDGPAVEKVVYGAEHGRLWLSWEPKDANEGGTKVQSKAGVNV